MKTILLCRIYFQSIVNSIDSVLTRIFGEISTDRVVNDFPVNPDRRKLETASRAFNLKKQGGAR